MSESAKIYGLAGEAVEVVHGAMLKNMAKIARSDSSSARQAQNTDNTKALSDSDIAQLYRALYIEMYSQYLTQEQLKAIIEFHGSEMGRSISKAQIDIQDAVTKKISEFRKSGSGLGKDAKAAIHTREVVKNLNDPDL